MVVSVHETAPVLGHGPTPRLSRPQHVPGRNWFPHRSAALGLRPGQGEAQAFPCSGSSVTLGLVSERADCFLPPQGPPLCPGVLACFLWLFSWPLCLALLDERDPLSGVCHCDLPAPPHPRRKLAPCLGLGPRLGQIPLAILTFSLFPAG